MKIDLKCSECGSNNFTYPMVLTDRSVIVCADCAHEIGTVADIQEKVIAQLQSRAKD